MRKVLIVGAGLCFVIGLYLTFAFVDGIIFIFQQNGFQNNYWNYPLIIGIVSFYFGYVFLAFTPMIMLIRSRKIKMPRLHLVLISVAGAVVILLFLAMLFPGL